MFSMSVGRAASLLAEHSWNTDSGKARHLTCYDQLQREYEDEDFLPSLAIKSAAEARLLPNLLPLPVWTFIFLRFSPSLYDQSTHIPMHTVLSQHLHLCNPITNPRVNHETLNCELLRTGLCFSYCASALANNHPLLYVISLKASGCYTTEIPIQLSTYVPCLEY